MTYYILSITVYKGVNPCIFHVDAKDGQQELGMDMLRLVVAHGYKVEVENYMGVASQLTDIITPDDFYEKALEYA